MRKFRVLVVATTIAVAAAVPGIVSPAGATHSCALDDPTANAICEGIHDVPQILFCKVAPKFC
ncbi:MAG: hypothetical protein ACRDLB_01910 [Actinomycetota bacterium]